jgi:hypothetical protein
MPRYSNIPIIQDSPRRYIQVKYPEIPLDFTDTYVYTTRGDRYDTLALTYYNDPSLWWVISIANPSLGCDSLIPSYGSQIRIPAFFRVSSIISKYESLNLNIRNEQLSINNR